MSKIDIDGKKFEVTENLGFQAGRLAKMVQTESGEKVAVKEGGKWRIWTTKNRLGENDG